MYIISKTIVKYYIQTKKEPSNSLWLQFREQAGRCEACST